MILLKHILVATDFGEAADTAFVYGRNFARTFQATLHPVHVVDDLSWRLSALASFPESLANIAALQAETETAARVALDTLLTGEDRQLLHARPKVLTSSDAAQAILDYADDIRADIVIAGTHGRGGFERVVLGSVAERLVRLARCPVLVVRQPEREFVRPDALERAFRSRLH